MRHYHKIYLHGYLGEKYTTEPIEIYSRDLPDTVNGLTCRFGKGFKAELLSGSWSIIKGELAKENVIPPAEVGFTLVDEEIHIVPRVEGAITLAAISAVAGVLGATGTVTAIAGLSALATTVINVALLAVSSIALSAVSKAIAGSPTMDYAGSEAERKPSFLFNGAINVVEQGGPVPLIYGKHLAGSTVVSVSMTSDEIGEINNELGTDEVNFILPVALGWTGVGATLNTIANQLTITKTTAAGVYGGAELTLNLEPETEYKAYFKMVVTYLYTDAGLQAHYEDITVDALDGTTVLGYSEIADPVVYTIDGSTPAPDKFIYPTFTFTTLAAQVTPRLRIYPAITAEAGTIRNLYLIKVEKTHV